MSQYPQYPPSPYAGPPLGYYPPPGPSAGRRAGLLMFVLGPIVLLLGACFVGMAFALPAIAAQSPQQVDELRSKMNLPAGVPLGAVMGVAGGIVALPGAAMLGLAAFVRRGRRWATVTALVIAGLVLLWLLVNVVAALSHLADGSGLAGGCVGVVAAAAFGLLVAWLIAALREGPARADPYQQYLSQYYYHQQMAQAYGVNNPAAEPPGYGQGGGYGYAAQPDAPAAPDQNPDAPV